MIIPTFDKRLSSTQVLFLEAFSQSCRHSIIAMLKQSQSGHPGGSLSCIDYLTLLYSFVLSQTGEPLVVSNGHISPAIYAILSEMGYLNKAEVITGFRKIGYPYEGHVTRHVPGVWYGTGPLGVGVSAASGFALAEKIKQSNKTVYALIGDGESQEGQVYEMMNFANKYKLDNFVVFMDYNKVQLTDSLESIMPLSPKLQWEAADWEVIEVDGHNFTNMWEALAKAKKAKKPSLLLGNTLMGKGITEMESEGKKHKATWHGKAPNPEQSNKMLAALALSKKQTLLIDDFRKNIISKPKANQFPAIGSPTKIKSGTPILYKVNELTDCRTAYGKALLDLVKKNKSVVALTADLSGSVMTSFVKNSYPDRHIDVGVAEQQMVSAAGGMSLNGLTPFCSTFGVFMTSRAKDQARVNDINNTNVKMVATHCGLSVGEDGPTHQAIDDMGSMMGLLNTMVIEPADPNHCDRIIRFVATHYGNCYVRMGRHKLPVLTTESGKPLYDTKYVYKYGRCDLLRSGNDLTIAAGGSTVIEALKAHKILQTKNINAEVIIMSSPKKFDNTLYKSIKKTGKLITVEDHTIHSGYAASLSKKILEDKIKIHKFISLGVHEYQLSGTAADLYDAASISTKHIVKAAKKIIK